MNPAASGLVGAPSVAHPARALNTTFSPSATRPVLVIYSVRIFCNLTIAGGQAGRVELRCDAASPPVTVQCRIAGGSTGAVIAGINIGDTVEGILSFLVPEGHNVRLVTVNEAGVPTYTLTNSTEITL